MSEKCDDKGDMSLVVTSKKFDCLEWKDLNLLFMVGQVKLPPTTDGRAHGEFLYCLKGEGSLEDVFYLAYEIVEHLQEELRENGDPRDLIKILLEMRKGVMRDGKTTFFGTPVKPKSPNDIS